MSTSHQQALRDEHGRAQTRQRPLRVRYLEILHEDAARACRQVIKDTLVAIYRAETVIPKLALSLGHDDGGREIVKGVHEEINAVIDKADGELDTETKQLLDLISQNGLGDVPPLEYSRPPYRFPIEISSPMAVKFLPLLEKIDKAIGHVELLWLNGVFDCYQHIDGPKKMIKVAYSASNRIRQIQQTVENGLRSKQAERAAAREADKRRKASIVDVEEQHREQEAGGEPTKKAGTRKKKTTAKKPPVEPPKEEEAVSMEAIEAESARIDDAKD